MADSEWFFLSAWLVMLLMIWTLALSLGSGFPYPSWCKFPDCVQPWTGYEPSNFLPC